MKQYIETVDYFYTQEKFILLYDENLDMLVTTPLPKHPENYYQSASYISHSDQSKTLIDKIYLLIKTYSLKRKVRLLTKLYPKRGKVLDIGAGTGEFLLAAKNKNWEVTGVEPNQLATKNALSKGIALYPDLNSLENELFDIITLWHVLEHLPDLENQIQKIVNLVSNKGVLIIAVPNYKSFDAQKYKNYWAAYDVPRHLSHFSKTSIIKLFQPHGFELTQVKPMWFDSFYVSLLSEKYKAGKNRYIPAFCNGLYSNIKGLFSKEYSSHIYVLKKR